MFFYSGSSDLVHIELPRTEQNRGNIRNILRISRRRSDSRCAKMSFKDAKIYPLKHSSQNERMFSLFTDRGKSKVFVAIRVDSGDIVGTGHLTRCIAIAKMLRNEGATVLFVSGSLKSECRRKLEKAQFDFRLLGPRELVSSRKESEWLGTSEKIDVEQTREVVLSFFSQQCFWLVIDHYSIGKDWQRTARTFAKKILVIEDLADRELDCDVLLDYSYYPGGASRYRGLVPDHCQLLLGPKYVPLDAEFFGISRNRERRCMVYFGGANTGDLLLQGVRAVAASKLSSHGYEVDVVIGKDDKHSDAIVTVCDEYKFNYLPWVNNMPELMSRTAVCLGAGGVSIYERLYYEVYSILISVAQNQREPLQELSKERLVIYLGHYDEIGQEIIVNALNQYILDRQELGTLEVARGNQDLLSLFFQSFNVR